MFIISISCVYNQITAHEYFSNSIVFFFFGKSTYPYLQSILLKQRSTDNTPSTIQPRNERLFAQLYIKRCPRAGRLTTYTLRSNLLLGLLEGDRARRRRPDADLPAWHFVKESGNFQSRTAAAPSGRPSHKTPATSTSLETGVR